MARANERTWGIGAYVLRGRVQVVKCPTWRRTLVVGKPGRDSENKGCRFVARSPGREAGHPR